MDTELKMKWVEALRSGKYQQGRSALCNAQNQYCCLGVLCEVLGYPKVKPYPNEVGAYQYRTPYGVTSSFFYSSTVRELGLNAYTKDEPTSDAHTYLMTMNDELKLSFNQIADWIEANL